MEPAVPTQKGKQEKKPLVFPERPLANPNWKPREITLTSNHFRITVKDPKVLIKVYAIEIDPEVPLDWRSGNQVIVNSAKEPIKAWLKADFSTSGKVLFSLGGTEEQKIFATTFSGKDYSIRLKKVRDTSLSSEIFKNNETAAATRQFINVVIKKILKYDLKLTEWGMNSKFYDIANKIGIPQHAIDIYQGFKTSCEVYSNFTPRLLIDFSSRIVRRDSVLAYIKAFQRPEDAAYDLIGKSVVATYGNCRMYRVDDINFKKSPKSTFLSDKTGKQTSYIEYYKTAYNITIKDANQPLIVTETRDGKFIDLIPELVHMTGLSDQMKNDFRIMKEVANHTRLEPKDRWNRVAKVRDSISKPLEKAGMTLDQVSKVIAYKLDPPELAFGNKSFVPDKGNFQFRDPVRKAAVFDNWVCVYHGSCYGDAENFEITLKKACGAYGIKVSSPNWLEVTDRASKAWGSAIDTYLTKNPKTQIVVVIIPPPAKGTVYPIVKQICSKDHGIPSQVVVTASLNKNTLSVCSKILLQMNAKVGLPLWQTAMPKNWGKRKAMVIGVDVFHNIGKAKKSCIGFCASLDANMTKFFTKVKTQPGTGQELMPNLASLVEDAIKAYLKVNKEVPETIILYRDGVGESQIGAVMEQETKLIIEKFANIDPNYKPQFAEIIVTKRINDRFFGTAGKDGCSNPPSGTVVARDVVSNNFDFFLVAQDVNMGTCTPTHYNVVCNNTNLSADIFYELTYRQCFNYYNWSGPIRVPAPVMYAHKAGFVAGQTYQSEHKATLDHTLFFL